MGQHSIQTPRRFATLLLLACAALAGCATSPTGRTQLMVIPPDAAILESRVAYLSTVRQLARENRLLHDPWLAERVQFVTGRVVAEAVVRYPHTAGWNWSVALIDEPNTVNAWCMAGGRMAIYSGMFERLRLTDDELAQVMSHEISHALANHTAERMSRALITTGGLMATEALLDIDAAGMSRAAVAANLAISLPNSRAAESEADRIGIELAALAGYDPQAAVSLWDKMEREGRANPPAFLSTHPPPAYRRATLSAMVPGMRLLMPIRFRRQPHPVDVLP